MSVFVANELASILDSKISIGRINIGLLNRIIIDDLLLDDQSSKEMLKVTRLSAKFDILDMDQTTAPYFMEIGMHCLGCPASRGETIAEACEVHGVDCDELLEKLNAHLASKKA